MMNTTRWKVRSYAAQRGVMMFEIANVLGISDAWFSKKLRADLPEEELKKMDPNSKEYAKAEQSIAEQRSNAWEMSREQRIELVRAAKTGQIKNFKTAEAEAALGGFILDGMIADAEAELEEIPDCLLTEIDELKKRKKRLLPDDEQRNRG